MPHLYLLSSLTNRSNLLLDTIIIEIISAISYIPKWMNRIIYRIKLCFHQTCEMDLCSWSAVVKYHYTSDVWCVSFLACIILGAPSACSSPVRPLSLWGQTVPGLCHQPEWPEFMWGLQWSTQTVQVLPWWVCGECLLKTLYTALLKVRVALIQRLSVFVFYKSIHLSYM